VKHVTKLLGISLVLFSLVLAGGCSQKSDSGEDGTKAGPATGTGASSGLVVGARIGNLAPDFQLKRLAGGNLKLSSLRGKIVILDFWDTWCPPCRRALPHLQELSQTYAGDLVVVGVAMGRDGEAKVRSYIKENGLTFEFVLADAPQYQVMRDFGGIRSIPTTFLLDRDGVIKNIWTGAMPKAEYEKGVRQLLGS